MFFSEIRYVILKITEQCNLRCKYCYVPEVEKNNCRIVMSNDLLEKAIYRIVSQSNQPKIRFCFHGGEPLLLGKEGFQNALEYIGTMEKKFGKKLNVLIQTNATLIDDEWIEIFKEYQIRPGVSIDGPPEIHNLARQKGEETERAIRLLNEAGIGCGLLAVIGRHNVERIDEVIRYFVEKLRCRHMKFHPLQKMDYTNADSLAISDEEYLKVVAKIYNYMIDGYIEGDNEMWEYIRRFLAHRKGEKVAHGLCYGPWCQSGSGLISVNAGGDIAPCGRWYNEPEVKLGHLDDPDPVLVLNRMKYVEQYIIRKDDSWDKCRQCEKADVCKFSCTAWRYMTTKTNSVDDLLCKQMDLLWDFFIRDEDKLEKRNSERIKNKRDKKRGRHCVPNRTFLR